MGSSCDLLLQELGADAQCIDKDGFTALHHACQCGHAQCLAPLIELGCDVNAPICPEDGSITEGACALHLAAQAGHTEVTLVTKHVTTKPQTPKPQTPNPRP